MGMSYIRYRRNGRRACGNSGRPLARARAKMLRLEPPGVRTRAPRKKRLALGLRASRGKSALNV